MKHFFTFFLLLSYLGSNAQSFPVSVQVQTLGKLDMLLSSYATSTQPKINYRLHADDVSALGKSIRMQLSIEGDRLMVQNLPFVIGGRNITLSSPNMVLNNVDLRANFELQNLQGITPQTYSNPLPSGVYKFCATVFDVNTQQQLSQKSCGVSQYLVLNDPPILNMPQRNEQIAPSSFYNILFQWTPRQVNATNVKYSFELREVWDEYIDPQAAFLASPNYYTKETPATTFVYTAGNPPLTEGKLYAWRVKATSLTGGRENAVFKNNGYSEILYFRYGSNCATPQGATAILPNKTEARIRWLPNIKHDKYKVQYRFVGIKTVTRNKVVKDSETNKALRDEEGKKIKEEVEIDRRVPSFWFDIDTKTPEATIGRLKPGNLYEYRVGGHCPTNRYEANPAYTYGPVQKFTLDKDLADDDTTVLEEEEFEEVTNTDPIDSLKVGDVFMAYDYEVQITDLKNPSGDCLTGEGATYLNAPGVNNELIKVAYECVKVNTDKRLFEGKVASTYTPDWKNIKVSDYGGISDSLGKPNGSKDNPIKPKDKDGNDLIIDDITVNDKGEVVVLTGGTQKPIDEFLGENGLSGSGTTYIETTDSKGNTTKYQISTGPSGANNLGVQTTTVSKVESTKDADQLSDEQREALFWAEVDQEFSPENADWIDFLQMLNDIKKFYKNCGDGDWASYENKGIVPQCFWKNSVAQVQYAPGDLPFAAGIIDGGYGEVTGLLQLADGIAGILEDFAFYKISCSLYTDKSKDPQQQIKEIKARIAEINSKNSAFTSLKIDWQKNKLKLINDCQKAKTNLDAAKKTATELWEIAKNWDELVATYKKLEADFKEYFGKVKGLDSQARYLQGKLLIPTATTFVGVGAATKIAKVKTTLKTLETLPKAKKAEIFEEVVRKSGSYLDNITGYKQLFKEGKVLDLFNELKKTTAFPKMGNTRVRNQADLLSEYKAKYGQNANNYPYSTTNPVTDFELAETGYFVRVYSGDSKNSSWIFRIEDLRKYKNVDEIVEKLALPDKPAKFGLVEIPPNTKLRKSIAGPQKWSNATKPQGGGIQYEIIGERNNDWFSVDSFSLESFFK